MYELVNLEKEEYEKFVKNNKYKSHFLQSYAWGQFAKAKKGLFPYYLGLKNEDNEIIASSLLLQKRLPLGYSYFYSPRGFVLDYTDEKTFSLFTKEIVKFVKAKKAYF